MWIKSNKSDLVSMRMWVQSLASLRGIAESCGIGRRHSSDPAVLRLWHKPAVAAPIQPLAWELPYAIGVALKTNKQKQTHRSM